MTAQAFLVPRRSLLYMPGANARALEKAQSLDCDTIIFDLEDAVAPDAKVLARSQVLAALEQNTYGHRELVVRCNGLNTPWGMDDLHCFANAAIGALLFPKIESAAQIAEIRDALASHGSSLPRWIMLETPPAVLSLQPLAAEPQAPAPPNPEPGVPEPHQKQSHEQVTDLCVRRRQHTAADVSRQPRCGSMLVSHGRSNATR